MTGCVLPCLCIPAWKVRKACVLKLGLSQAFPARALVTQKSQQRTTYPEAHQPTFLAQHKPSISSRGICPKICR